MATKQYERLHAVTRSVAASRAGSWLYARTLHHLDRLVLRVSRGRRSATSVMSSLPLVLVTTTGARSGLPRTIPLLCIRSDDAPATFAVIASNWGQKRYPAWYFNLKANPRATCAIDGAAGAYLAHEATGEEYARYWRAASATYLGYPLYRQRISGRAIPIIVLTPQ